MSAMKNDDDLRQLLKTAIRPTSGELQRNLWPHMLRRMDEKPNSVPWLDWVLAVAMLALLAVAPAAIPILLYQL